MREQESQRSGTWWCWPLVIMAGLVFILGTAYVIWLSMLIDWMPASVLEEADLEAPSVIYEDQLPPNDPWFAWKRGWQDYEAWTDKLDDSLTAHFDQKGWAMYGYDSIAGVWKSEARGHFSDTEAAFIRLYHKGIDDRLQKIDVLLGQAPLEGAFSSRPALMSSLSTVVARMRFARVCQYRLEFSRRSGGGSPFPWLERLTQVGIAESRTPALIHSLVSLSIMSMYTESLARWLRVRAVPVGETEKIADQIEGWQRTRQSFSNMVRSEGYLMTEMLRSNTYSFGELWASLGGKYDAYSFIQHLPQAEGRDQLIANIERIVATTAQAYENEDTATLQDLKDAGAFIEDLTSWQVARLRAPLTALIQKQLLALHGVNRDLDRARALLAVCDAGVQILRGATPTVADPMGAGSILVRKMEGGGIRIWSVGPDGLDNGGVCSAEIGEVGFDIGSEADYVLTILSPAAAEDRLEELRQYYVLPVSSSGSDVLDSSEISLLNER